MTCYHSKNQSLFSAILRSYLRYREQASSQKPNQTFSSQRSTDRRKKARSSNSPQEPEIDKSWFTGFLDPVVSSKILVTKSSSEQTRYWSVETRQSGRSTIEHVSCLDAETRIPKSSFIYQSPKTNLSASETT